MEVTYQKSTNGGGYQPIGGDGEPKSASKKWVYGAVIVAIAASVAYFALNKSGAAATDAAVAKAGLTKGKDGRLKLFDEHSK